MHCYYTNHQAGSWDYSITPASRLCPPTHTFLSAFIQNLWAVPIWSHHIVIYGWRTTLIEPPDLLYLPLQTTRRRASINQAHYTQQSSIILQQSGTTLLHPHTSTWNSWALSSIPLSLTFLFTYLAELLTAPILSSDCNASRTIQSIKASAQYLFTPIHLYSCWLYCRPNTSLSGYDGYQDTLPALRLLSND